MFKITSFGNWFLALITIVLAAIVLAVLPSCSSSKSLNYRKDNKDSIALQEETIKREILEKDTAEYRRMIREMEYLSATFSECPEIDTASIRKLFEKECPPARVDSVIRVITQPPTTVKKNADGSLEITSSRLKTVTQSKIRLEEENARLIRDYKKLEEENRSLKVQKTETHETKQVKKKSSFMNSFGFWLTLIIIAFITGVYVGVKKHKFFTTKNTT